MSLIHLSVALLYPIIIVLLLSSYGYVIIADTLNNGWKYFSAVCWLYGRMLHDKLKVSITIIAYAHMYIYIYIYIFQNVRTIKIVLKIIFRSDLI